MAPRAGTGRRALAGWCCACVLLGAQADLGAQDLKSLQARYTSLRGSLANNPFQRRLDLQSSESPTALRGDIHAVVDHPFAVVSPALQHGTQWCDILMLHLNVKRCRAGERVGGDMLSLIIGTKVDQPLADAHRFEFAFRPVATRPDYLQIVLDAAQGPMGTSDYRFVLEVMPLDANSSFVHLSYAYSFGVLARVATQAYLATSGRNKVGFTVTGPDAQGKPVHIRGTRGVIERNTMRYYLAIVAYLDALATPVPQRLEKRLSDWHAAVERYPLQLHEIDRADYLALKRKQMEAQPTLGDRDDMK